MATHIWAIHATCHMWPDHSLNKWLTFIHRLHTVQFHHHMDCRAIHCSNMMWKLKAFHLDTIFSMHINNINNINRHIICIHIFKIPIAAVHPLMKNAIYNRKLCHGTWNDHPLWISKWNRAMNSAIMDIFRCTKIKNGPIIIDDLIYYYYFLLFFFFQCFTTDGFDKSWNFAFVMRCLNRV